MKIKLRKSVLLIFLLGLIAACWYMEIPIKPLLTDMLVRLPMNGVFVLALLLTGCGDTTASAEKNTYEQITQEAA